MQEMEQVRDPETLLNSPTFNMGIIDAAGGEDGHI